MQLAIQVDSRKAQAFFSNLSRNMEDMGEELPRECAKMAAIEYIKSAKTAGIESWKGTFYGTLKEQAINPTKLGKNAYGVSIAPMKRGKVNYFVGLDRMIPHWVALKRNRLITKWAFEKGFALPVSGKMTSKYAIGLATIYPVGGLRKIFVRPHPFINQADLNIFKKIPKIEKKMLREKIRKSKR